MMTQFVKLFFRDVQQYRLFMILSLSTVFDCLLVAYRTYHIHFDWSQAQNFRELWHLRGAYATFFFLVWNLFLAWVPYWFALTLDFFTRIKTNPSVYSVGFLMVMWLLFFPNAPYIVTDLLHLRERETIPMWYDVMMFVSFAWTGLLLGYCSLFEVERYVKQRFGQRSAWFFSVIAIWLGGFGVYMGRFQRWNSWDIVNNPFRLISQQIEVLSNPLDNLHTLGVAVVLSGFLLIGYWTLNAFRTVPA